MHAQSHTSLSLFLSVCVCVWMKVTGKDGWASERTRRGDRQTFTYIVHSQKVDWLIIDFLQWIVCIDRTLTSFLIRKAPKCQSINSMILNTLNIIRFESQYSVARFCTYWTERERRRVDWVAAFGKCKTKLCVDDRREREYCLFGFKSRNCDGISQKRFLWVRQMNEWASKWTSKRTNERMSDRPTDQTNDSVLHIWLCLFACLALPLTILFILSE